MEWILSILLAVSHILIKFSYVQALWNERAETIWIFWWFSSVWSSFESASAVLLVRGVKHHELQWFSYCICLNSSVYAVFHGYLSPHTEATPSHTGLQSIFWWIIGFVLHIPLHRYLLEFNNRRPAGIWTRISWDKSAYDIIVLCSWCYAPMTKTVIIYFPINDKDPPPRCGNL